MTGPQLIHAIRTSPPLADSRVILLRPASTAAHSDQDTYQDPRNGNLQSVGKPVRRAELWSALMQSVDIVSDPAPDVAAAEPPPQPVKLRGRVLLAEDNVVNQIVAEAMLTNLGLTVEIANDGQEALLLAAVQSFDIILMDCQMPVLDGYEATRSLRLRETENGRRRPVIALTANAMEGDRKQCLAAGMDDYLAKPYTQEQLEHVLNHWLNNENGLPAGETSE